MKRLIIISFCIAGLLSQMSCSEDWLKPKPLSFFAPENVYVNEAGFEALLVTMRRDLKSETHGNMNYINAEWSYSDMAIAFTQPDYATQLTPDVSKYYPYLTIFNQAYKNIRNANTLITRIDDIIWSSTGKRDAVLAEAYFFRSYWYYRLVNSYGDVPFENEEVTTAKLDYYSTSRWAILSYIQKDMEFAVQKLPEKSQVKPGEVSRGAGDHLLAKICLANTDFDGAIAAASRVINGPYALMKDIRFGQDKADPEYNVIWDLHRCANKNLSENTETILATVDRESDPAATDASGAQIGARDPAGTYAMRLYNPAVWNASVRDSQGKAGMLQSGKTYRMYGRGNNNAKPVSFYNYGIWNGGGYNWRNTPDLRRSDANWVDLHELTYTNPASVDYKKPINPAYFATPSDTIYCFNAIQHYKFYVPQSDTIAVPNGGNGDWYIFRLAETYLLRAEAYFWKNELTPAREDINMVRERSKAPLITEADVTIDYIFNERARELFGETPRHNELVRASYIMARLNKDGYTLADFSKSNYFYDKVMRDNIYLKNQITFSLGKAQILPHNVLWPINSAVILANTLGVINQNEGYTGADKNVPPLETIE